MRRFLSLVVVSLVFSGPAFSWWYHPAPVCNDSVYSVSTVIDQAIDSLPDPCVLVPLALVRTQDGSLTVDSWTGGYSRVVSMITTYEIDHYDYCSGALLGREEKKMTAPQTLTFDIPNSNLGEGLPSYVSNAPLTTDEAHAELPATLQICQGVHTGEWPQQ